MRSIDPEGTNWIVLIASTLVALLGILCAALVYYFNRGWDQALGRAFRPGWVFLTHRMYLDHLFEGAVVRHLFYRGISIAAQAFDTYVVDGVVNGVGWCTRRAGFYLRGAQNGELQTYGFVFLSGVVLIAALVFVLHP
jgi:NADH-quinone oxidoreductase subunit L